MHVSAIIITVLWCSWNTSNSNTQNLNFLSQSQFSPDSLTLQHCTRLLGFAVRGSSVAPSHWQRLWSWVWHTTTGQCIKSGSDNAGYRWGTKLKSLSGPVSQLCRCLRTSANAPAAMSRCWLLGTTPFCRAVQSNQNISITGAAGGHQQCHMPTQSKVTGRAQLCLQSWVDHEPRVPSSLCMPAEDNLHIHPCYQSA